MGLEHILSDIIEEQLRAKYPEMDDFVLGYVISYDNALRRNKLYEGLIMSHESFRVIRILNKKYKYLNSKVMHLHKDNIKIHISHFNKKINKSFLADIDNFIHLTDTLGWFISNIQFTNISGTHSIPFDFAELTDMYNDNDIFDLNIFLEAKFNLKPRKLPKLLYHIAPTENRNSIMKHGLKPKSNNKMFGYPERLYFFTDIKMLDYQIKNFKNVNEVEQYDVFEIGGGLVSQLRFLIDPKLKGAVYTLEPISKYDIKLIDTR